MALSAAFIEQGTSTVFSYISTKVQDKASWADNIARLEIALARMDIALEKIGRIPITLVSLLRRWKDINRVYMEGTELLNKLKKSQEEKDGQVVVRSSSYLQWIADKAANFSISSLVGLGKDEKLCFFVVQKFERYADWAEKFLAEVECGSPLRHHVFRYPFLRHLFEGKTLRCEVIKNPSQSVSFILHPVFLEGRGVEARLRYEYEDLRKPEECFDLILSLRISEDSDLIGICMKCMQWLISQFKVVAEPAIELTLLPELQDIFHSYVLSPWFVKHAYVTEQRRPDPICCNGNSCKLSLELGVPDTVINIYFRCYMSAPQNNLRNGPLPLYGSFSPHMPGPYRSHEGITVMYGRKSEDRNCSVQQLPEIARSEGVDYLVHEPEATRYALLWCSPHGTAIVTISRPIPRPGRRRVSKRKR